MVEKYYNENGELGVLISPGFGAGWSSWNCDEIAFDKRVVEYWDSDIKPELEKGKKVIIAAHGNSLRGLIKYLDNMSDEDVIKLELQTGNPICYELDDNLKPIRHYYLKEQK